MKTKVKTLMKRAASEVKQLRAEKEAVEKSLRLMDEANAKVGDNEDLKAQARHAALKARLAGCSLQKTRSLSIRTTGSE